MLRLNYILKFITRNPELKHKVTASHLLFMRLCPRLTFFRSMSISELQKLTHEELVERNMKLEDQIKQLRGRIINMQNDDDGKPKRKVDLSKFTKRRIALKILYLGWDYSGLARQDLTKLTVAEKVIEAFKKCRMIENSSEIGFAVCGRTDKGVSGFSQVVALTLRSNVHKGIGVVAPEDKSILFPEKEELDYVLIGNKHLPRDIRILAWCPVPLDFSPRHDCHGRAYKYYFPTFGLDIKKMRTAAGKLIGEHDFRNFCTSQVANGVVNYVRRIHKVDLSVDDTSSSGSPRQLCCMNIQGTAFLYHQIRCIASILIAIGRGLESPEVIDALLDVEKTPGKPQYQMAEPEPLLFFQPQFDGLEWQTSEVAMDDIIRNMQRIWTQNAVRAKISEVMLAEVEKMFPERHQNNYLAAITREVPFLVGPKRKPLLKRTTEEPLEEKIKKIEAKRSKKKVDSDSDH